MSNDIAVSHLVGMTMKSVTENGHELGFVTENDELYELYHNQDCCECVYIESIVGDLSDLVGVPLLLAEEVGGYTPNDSDSSITDSEESYTWTFYKFGTIKGYVDVRWLGTSKGYYSESVYFARVK